VRAQCRRKVARLPQVESFEGLVYEQRGLRRQPANG